VPHRRLRPGYAIARLRVFGSAAYGSASPDSDIDVVHEREPGRPLGWDIGQSVPSSGTTRAAAPKSSAVRASATRSGTGSVAWR
jgi:hypothetical protein